MENKGPKFGYGIIEAAKTLLKRDKDRKRWLGKPNVSYQKLKQALMDKDVDMMHKDFEIYNLKEQMEVHKKEIEQLKL